MSRYHGITENTYKNFIIDSGEVRLNYVDQSNQGSLIGATRGGSQFTIETEYREMPVDGAKGPTKGDTRITKVTAKMVCNFVEFSKDLLVLAFPGSSSADWPVITPTHDAVTRSLQIALSDYKTSVVLLGEVSGSSSPIICGLQNVLAKGNIEISAADNDESVVAVTFVAHFDPDTMDAEPWFIRYPQDVAATTTTAGA